MTVSSWTWNLHVPLNSFSSHDFLPSFLAPALLYFLSFYSHPVSFCLLHCFPSLPTHILGLVGIYDVTCEFQSSSVWSAGLKRSIIPELRHQILSVLQLMVIHIKGDVHLRLRF